MIYKKGKVFLLFQFTHYAKEPSNSNLDKDQILIFLFQLSNGTTAIQQPAGAATQQGNIIMMMPGNIKWLGWK